MTIPSFAPPRLAARLALASLALAPALAGAQRVVQPAANTPKELRANALETTSAGREQTADQQVNQVLNRLAFGPRPGEALAVRNMGVDAWIDQQLHPDRIDDSAIDQLIARYPLLNQDQTQLAMQYQQALREARLAKRDKNDTTPLQNLPELQTIRREHNQLIGEIESERVARAVASNRQLQEVMTDFWENHFNVFVGKNPVEAYYLADYDRTIREHALGKFRDLLGAVAHSPAMLVYLDNAQSRANPGQPTLAAQGSGAGGGMVVARGGLLRAGLRLGAVRPLQARQAPQAGAKKAQAGLNENYGRELMELHTLGVDGGYTQQDVIEAARALTGWSVKPPAQGGGFIFRPQWHDAAEKTFLGHKLAAGRGEQDGEDVLDILARSPATAHFISLELCRRFVSDSPSTALVAAAAQTYMKTDGDIREVMRTIVTSPQFFSERAYHSKVKSPFEVVVSTARALGAEPDTTPRTALAVAYLGEPIFGHRDPNGYPETGDAWMNTGAILNRINFGMAVGADRLPGATVEGFEGADALSNAPRETQVNAVVNNILEGAVSPDTRKILTSGEHPLAGAAIAQASQPSTMQADSSAQDANDAADGKEPRAKGKQNAALRGLNRNPIVGPAPQLTGFAQVVGLAIGSPEFQRH